jgi:hypothetical protein
VDPSDVYHHHNIARQYAQSWAPQSKASHLDEDEDELELLLEDDELLPPRTGVSMHMCHAHVCTSALVHLCTYAVCFLVSLVCGMCDHLYHVHGLLVCT